MMDRELDPVRPLVFRVWFAFFWRIFLGTVFIGFVMGTLFGFVGGAGGMSQEDIGTVAGPFSMITFMVVLYVVLQRLMIKGFGPFRLAIMEKSSA